MKVVCLFLSLLVGYGQEAQAFSRASSFTRSWTMPRAMVGGKPSMNNGGLVMYDSSTDPPSDKSRGQSNMWSVLATTEKWIANVLGEPDQNNPYTRKEVSYVCEQGDEDALVTAAIWRRLKEAREIGVNHGHTQEELLMEHGVSYSPKTFRQTMVVVIPNNEAFTDKFSVFNDLVSRINQARRSARDFVTDLSLEKIEAENNDEIGERDWVVAVNCAHLHPNFGEKSPKQVLQEMMEEEERGEVDVNLQNYKRKKELARRSPYPTVVVEVLATPPPDNYSPPSEENDQQQQQQQPDSDVSGEDVRRLEALFGKSAAFDHPAKNVSPEEQEDAFYDAIANSIGIQEITLFTPLILAQNWIAAHDDDFNSKTCTFTHTDTQHVDAAFEFVFNNLAMKMSKDEAKVGNRQYLVFSKLVSTSATSLEKFAMLLKGMIAVLPGLAKRVQISTYHPEHVSSSKRSPYPVLVIAWV